MKTSRMAAIAVEGAVLGASAPSIANEMATIDKSIDADIQRDGRETTIVTSTQRVTPHGAPFKSYRLFAARLLMALSSGPMTRRTTFRDLRESQRGCGYPGIR